MRLFPRLTVRTILPVVSLFAAFATPSARAQTNAQELPPSTAPTASPQAPSVTTPVPLPMPNVTDPMLTPVPPAPVQIATWQEALDLVRSRSTDLRVAYDEVQRALGLQREALAGALPIINATGAVTQNLLTRTSTIPNPTGAQLVDANGNPIGLDANSAPTAFDASGNAIPIAPGKFGTRTLYGPPQSNTTPIPNYATGGITLTQPILALRAWHQIGTAHVATDASRLSLDDIKRTLALGVANAIVGVVTAERVAELNRSGLQQSLERLDLTVRKQRLGAATGLDVVRAQQDVELARTTLVTGDESLRKSRESLGLAVGIPGEVGVPRTIQIDGLERDAIRTCKPSPSVDERSDVVAARTRLKVAMRNIDDVWLQFAPTINGQSNLSTSTLAGFASLPTTWSISAVLSWNIWDGGARYGALRDNRAQADEAQQNLELLHRQALIQVEQAQRAVTVANDQLRVADRARALAVQNDQLTQIAYREGQLTSLDLVVAAAARRQAEITLALDQFNLVQARVGAVLALANCAW